MMEFASEVDLYKKRCLELEEKSKKDEIRCFKLEAEVEELRRKKKELEDQITMIQKVVSNGEKGKETIVDLTDDEYDGDKFVQLMIENKVLECEKTKAENELCVWKEKVTELVSRVCELESKLNMKSKDESSMRFSDLNVTETQLDANGLLINKNCSRVKKRLPFEEDGCPNKKMAPSTPGMTRLPFSGFIDVSDEDVSYGEIPKVKKLSDCDGLTKSQCSPNNGLEKTNEELIDEDDVDGYSRVPISSKRRRCLNIITSDDEQSNQKEEVTNESKGHSRKRVANIVTSDDESSEDDDALISKFKKGRKSKLKTEVKEDASKRRLTRLSKSESKNKQDKDDFDTNKIINLHGNNLSDDEEDEGSDGEDESLSGFIVDSSDSENEAETKSASDYASESGNSCDESEDEVKDYKQTLDKLRRKKDSNLNWECEGEMLADFGKDPELCMKAVCALYRQQTKDEKSCKETIYRNCRGFSHTDALRGSKLAEFLTDGDSGGDLNKTVEELMRYDFKGVELCMSLAAKYSKQLFDIYQKKEDPYFQPQ